MTFESLLQKYTSRLSEAGIDSARLDCLILLEDAAGKDRSWLLAHPEYEVSEAVIAELDTKIARRTTHEPLAYIRGRTEFYGRDFYVDRHVLEPRPESETMIDLLRELGLGKPTVVDVGTGSGALAITAKLELPQAAIFGTDVDPECLKVARRNAESLKASVSWLEGDLLSDFKSTTDVILANLPYVPDNFQINPAAMNEPRLAIFGGPDGLDLYRRMFGQLHTIPAPPRYVLTEALPPQHDSLAAIASGCGFVERQRDGFIQLFELVRA